MNPCKYLAGALALTSALAAPGAHAQFDLLRKLVPSVQAVQSVQAAAGLYGGRKHAEAIAAVMQRVGMGDRQGALGLAEALVAEDRKLGIDSPFAPAANMLRQSVGLAADLNEQEAHYVRAIELYQMLLATPGAAPPAYGMSADFAVLMKIGGLQQKAGDHAAAKRTYAGLLARPESQAPAASLFRHELHVGLGKAALQDGDDALAEANLLLAIEEDSSSVQANRKLSGDGTSYVEAAAALRGAFGQAAEMLKSMAADRQITGTDGELVSTAAGQQIEQSGILTVEGPLSDLASLFYRRHDVAALRKLYLEKLGNGATRNIGRDSNSIFLVELEKQYARFGAYFAGLDQHQLAGQALGEALRVNAQRLQAMAAVVPPEMLAGAFGTRRQVLDLLVSLRLRERADELRWRGTLGELLQGKGLQAEFLARRARIVGLSPDPGVRRLAAEIDAIDMNGSGTNYAHRMNTAVELQKKIGSLLPPLVFEEGGRFLAQVQQRLGSETLVSVTAFTSFDFGSQAFGARHYLGARTGRDGLRVADLGATETLDATGAGLRAELARRPSVRGAAPMVRAARTTYDALLAPLIGARAAKGAYVADLDGALSLLPMDALSDSSGRYLIEETEWRYVSSARALLANPGASATGQSLVIADPAYDLKMPATPSGRAPAFRNASLKGLHFEALPQTLEEGRAVQAALGVTGAQVDLYTGAEARMQVLAGLHSPRYLHIATHGFFVEEASIGREQGTGYDGRRYVAQAYLPGQGSGLALAGATQTLATGEGDGIITAAQLRQLDLAGTELAVLSACDTSVGVVRSGEGVDSLRQALEVAGARSTVTSLWTVPDLETRNMMADFYAALAAGKDKPASLRQAKLRVKQRQGHPYYWAAFVMTGAR